MYCTRCGQELTEGSDFCITCGADLRQARKLTPPPGATPPPDTPVRRTPGRTPPTPPPSIGDEATRLPRTEASAFDSGDVIADRYEVDRLLGEGGMGAVYRVRDRLVRDVIALKVMHPHLMSHERASERFVQEAGVSLRLSHENIVRVRDMGQVEDLRYLSMEFLEGCTLREWLQRLEREGRKVPVEAAESVVLQVLAALGYAHRYTVHRDIKPENIFLRGEEPDFRVKLLDFGIAKAMDRDTLTRTGTALGTALYMAPEQLKGASEVDARADIYSVGVVLHELLTGSLPVGGYDLPSIVRPELGPGWDELVLAAISQNPDKRPGDAASMGALVRELSARRRDAEKAAARQVAPPTVSGRTEAFHRFVEEQKRGESTQREPSGEDRRAAEPGPRLSRSRPPVAPAEPAPPRRRRTRLFGRIVLAAAILGAAGTAAYLGYRGWQTGPSEPGVPGEELARQIDDALSDGNLALAESLLQRLRETDHDAEEITRIGILITGLRQAQIEDELDAVGEDGDGGKVEIEPPPQGDGGESSEETGFDLTDLDPPERDRKRGDGGKSLFDVDFERVWAHLDSGQSFYDSGDFDLAIAEFGEAIRLDPRNAQAYVRRGYVYHTTGCRTATIHVNGLPVPPRPGDCDRAMSDFREALRLDPGLGEAHNGVGMVHGFREQWSRAIDSYAKAIENGFTHPAAFSNRAINLEAVGRLGEAIADYGEAIRRDPANPRYYESRARLHATEGNASLAEADRTKAAECCMRIGREAIQAGDFERATSWLERALGLGTVHDASAYYHRGVVFANIGDYGTAILDYEEALVLQPLFPEALLGLGLAHGALGNLEGAWEYLARAADLDPDGPAGEEARRALQGMDPGSDGWE